MAHPQPRTQILLPAHMSMHPVLSVRTFVEQVVKAEGSAQTLAVMLVCARARLAAPRAVNDTSVVLESIFELTQAEFEWVFQVRVQ